MAGTREPSALDRAVATRIRVLAAERNMKQSHVAAMAGIPTSTFGRYWNAERSMTLAELRSILDALGTNYATEAEQIAALVKAGE